ncbi:MAG: hypothetical protein AAF415_03505 [Pseudomonadota bacterium]
MAAAQGCGPPRGGSRFPRAMQRARCVALVCALAWLGFVPPVTAKDTSNPAGAIVTRFGANAPVRAPRPPVAPGKSYTGITPSQPLNMAKSVPPDPSAAAASNGFGPAVDWSLRSRAEQRFEVDTNRGLETPSDGTIYGSRTRLSTTLEAETKRSLVTTTLGFSGAVFGGPGDIDDATRLNPRLTSDLRYDGKDYELTGSLSASTNSTSVTQLEDTGITDVESTQITVIYDSELSWRLNPRSTLFLGTLGRVVDFTDDVAGLNPTRTFGASAGWAHSINSLTTLRFAGNLRYFAADNPAENRSQVFDFTVALNQRRTPRHRFGLRAGAVAVRVTEDGPGGEGTQFQTGGTGALTFNYTNDQLQADLSATQQVDPSSTGELQSFTRIAGSVGYRLTRNNRVSANLAYTRRADLDGDGDNRQLISFGPRYSYSLGRGTELGLGYLFRLSEESEDGTAIGHRFFLSLVHNLTLQP